MTAEAENRTMAVTLAKRQLVDAIWKTAGIEVDHPLDWQYVSAYNRILGQGLVRDAGKLRTSHVRIGGTDWIPDLPTTASSHDAIASLASIGSPEDRALRMFCATVRGQWFNDGNKRTALMAANHVLIRAGVGVLCVSPSLKREFTGLLLRYYESADAAPLCSWLKDNAIGRLPGGLTSAESRRLEIQDLPSTASSHGPELPMPDPASAAVADGTGIQGSQPSMDM